MAKGKAGLKKDEIQESEGFPVWVWWALFLLPLIASEFMFYIGGRGWSMLIFPIAWIGFWYTVMDRAGWPILPERWRARMTGRREEGGEP